MKLRNVSEKIVASCKEVCCGPRSMTYRVVRILVALFVLGCVFMAGAVSGIDISTRSPWVKSMRRNVPAWVGAAPTGDHFCAFGGGRACGKNYDLMPMMYGLGLERKDGVNTENFFGTITAIDKNRVTILDNGAQEQVVLSQSNTVIFSTSTKISITELRTGQNIEGFGVRGDDGVITANVIHAE